MNKDTKTALWFGGALLAVGAIGAIVVVSASKTNKASPGGGSPPSGSPGVPGGGPSTDGDPIHVGFPISLQWSITGDGTIDIVSSGADMVFYGAPGSSCSSDGVLSCVNVTSGDLKIVGAWSWDKYRNAFTFTLSGTAGEVLVIWQDAQQVKHRTTVKVAAPHIFHRA